MTLELTFAPLLFGLLWTFVLGMVGLHLRNQGRLVENKRAAATVPSSQAATVQYKEQQ